MDIDAAPTRPASRGVQLRPMKDSDLPQLLLLNDDVFGADFSQRFRERFAWAFQENLFPERTPKWVLSDGPRVVGFLATVPLPYRIDGHRIVAHTSCDFMVAPSHRFHGIKLMREFFRRCPNSVSSDDIPATIKVTQWLGAKPVGNVVRHMKPLDARLLRERGRWQGVPGPLWWSATQGLRVVDRLQEGSALGPPVQVVTELDERFSRFTRRLAETKRVMVDRDLAFFRWRYGEGSPHAHREVGGLVEADGELSGYVIFARCHEPSRTGIVLDLQVLGSAPRGASAALLRYAVRRLRRGGAWAVRYDELQPPTPRGSSPLKRLGFHPRGQQRLLIKLQSDDHMRVAVRPESWSFRYGDTESSYANT